MISVSEIEDNGPDTQSNPLRASLLIASNPNDKLQSATEFGFIYTVIGILFSNVSQYCLQSVPVFFSYPELQFKVQCVVVSHVAPL